MQFQRQARLSSGSAFLSFLFFLCFILDFADAAIVNRTIDDSFGDSETGALPTFLPATAGVWADETCVGCAIHPDTSRVFKGTYSAVTYNPGLKNTSISMGFNGTAIYVFFVLANNQGDGITTTTVADFILDGQVAGHFSHAPDLTTTDFQFNSLVFSKTGIQNGVHQLVISTSGVDFNVYVNFDYAIYTHVDSVDLPIVSSSMSSSSSSSASQSSSTSPHTPVTLSSTHIPSTTPSAANAGTNNANAQNPSAAGAIAGGVIGGLAFVTIIVVLMMLCRRRREYRHTVQRLELGIEPSPPMAQATQPYAYPSVQTGEPSRGPLLQSVEQTSTGLLRAGTTTTVSASESHSTSSHSINTGAYTQPPLAVRNPDSYNSYSGSSIVAAYQNSPSSIYPLEKGAASSSRYPSGVTNFAMLSGVPSNLGVRASEALTSPPTAFPSSVIMEDGFAAAQDPVTLTSPLTRARTREDVRRARQEELDHRMRMMKQEMNELKSELRAENVRRASMRSQRATGSSRTEEDDTELRDLREQVRAMKVQINFLKEQQRSEWALGLSDEPPPGYTPRSA